MTANQIAYWNYKEAQRNNQNTYAENVRSHMASEANTRRYNDIVREHNVASEINERNKLLESAKHNRASESIDLAKVAETQRSNRAKERQNEIALSETAYHNRKSEEQARRQLSEQHRSNVNYENIAQQNANTSTGTAYYNAYSGTVKQAWDMLNPVNWINRSSGNPKRSRNKH